MDEYGAVVKQIAEETDCLYADTQAAFEPILKNVYPASLAWDRVHPSLVGHMALAKTFLGAVDFKWQ